MNKDSKILVTGGSGLIGSYLLRELLQRGYENISSIHLPNDPLDLVQDIKDKIEWCEADVTNFVSMHDHFNSVDTVIHCAGKISFWDRELKEMFKVNVDGTANVVNLCLEHKVQQLIHLSSIEAIGKEEDNSIISETTEWKEEMVHTKYAVSKYYGELEVWRGQAEGLNTIIYNPALVFGAGYWDSGPMQLIRDVFKGLKYYPKGGIAVVDVRDLVSVMISNLNNEKMFGQRYIVGAHNLKFKIILDEIADKLKVQKPIRVLKGSTARLAIFVEALKSFFSRSKPLINKETYLVTDQELTYSFEKLKQVHETMPKSFEKSIADITTTFKDSFLAGELFGTLK